MKGVLDPEDAIQFRDPEHFHEIRRNVAENEPTSLDLEFSVERDQLPQPLGAEVPQTMRKIDAQLKRLPRHGLRGVRHSGEFVERVVVDPVQDPHRRIL